MWKGDEAQKLNYGMHERQIPLIRIPEEVMPIFSWKGGAWRLIQLQF